MLHNYIFILIWGWAVQYHPFYISLTDIRYEEGDRRLEISQKIFWDDLEVSLSKMTGEPVDFLKPEDREQLDSLLLEYLTTHNEITFDGQKVKFQYLGYEVEEEAAWFYMEARGISAPKVVGIKNSILLNEFEDQQNIVNFYWGKKPKSLILYQGNEKGQLTF